MDPLTVVTSLESPGLSALIAASSVVLVKYLVPVIVSLIKQQKVRAWADLKCKIPVDLHA